MRLIKAIKLVDRGREQRICKPGKWRVWRDGAVVHIERLGECNAD